MGLLSDLSNMKQCLAQDFSFYYFVQELRGSRSVGGKISYKNLLGKLSLSRASLMTNV